MGLNVNKGIKGSSKIGMIKVVVEAESIPKGLGIHIAPLFDRLLGILFDR